MTDPRYSCAGCGEEFATWIETYEHLDECDQVVTEDRID